MKNKLIIITGPTGSGKTELAVKLAKKFNAEIIGADSRQIYKGMKIGTAAPCQVPNSKFEYRSSKQIQNSNDQNPKRFENLNFENSNLFRPPALRADRLGEISIFGLRLFEPIGSERFRILIPYCLYKRVRHYLVGFLEPDKIFSVAEFKDAAIAIANDIISRGKIPIICGGTAHYIQAITENLDIPRIPPDWELRKKLEKKDLRDLIKQLKKLDPASLKIVDLKNKRRVTRAIEVCLAGLKFSETGRKKSVSSVFKKSAGILQIGIDVPRQELYKRIDERVDKMIKKGLILETKRLIRYFLFKSSLISSTTPLSQNNTELKHGTTQKLPCGSVSRLPGSEPQVLLPGSVSSVLSAIGYREILDYLDGKITIEETAQKIKFRTHRYVRYQMGWFRKNKKIRWVKNYREAERLVKNFLKKFYGQN